MRDISLSANPTIRDLIGDFDYGVNVFRNFALEVWGSEMCLKFNVWTRCELYSVSSITEDASFLFYSL